MAATYTAIQTITVGSGGQASISFTSIPQTYTDLNLKLSLKSTRTTDYIDDYNLSFNSNAANYYWMSWTNYNGTMRGDRNISPYSWIYGNAATGSHASQTPNTFGNADLYFPNYTSATNYKSGLVNSVTEQNGAQVWNNFQGNLWANSAPITSIALVSGVGGNWVQYSTATLYGIKNS